VPATAEDIATLVHRELAAVPDARLAQFMRGLLLKPAAVARAWNYGEPGLTYVCWVVLSHEHADSGVAYYEFRRPTANPWRAVQVSCPELAIPPGPGWHPSLLEAFVQSRPDTLPPQPATPPAVMPQTEIPQTAVPEDGLRPVPRSSRRLS
jgi:hypothetical protein